MPGRLLVTGATGFIGSHVVEIAAGGRWKEVHAVTHETPPSSAGVYSHGVDLLDPIATARLLSDIRPTHLVHLAWFVEPRTYWTSPQNDRWVEGSMQLFRSFARCGGERLLGVGTSAEYDWTDGILREGATALNPTTLYGASKKRLGQFAFQLCESHGISGAWARLFLVYGPREPPLRFIPRIIRALRGGEPAVCSPPEARRDFVYVRDAAAALLSVLESGVAGAVNIGSGVPTRLRDVVRLLVTELGHAERVTEREGSEAPLVVADVSRLRQEVGFSPFTDLLGGLRTTIEWWRRHEHQDRDDS